ncbi:hypothetical protein KP509_22G020900 [Ceratopteris richardii]|nr:hypothetical protein KP509_22G020900 [Ceratopteris richardii]
MPATDCAVCLAQFEEHDFTLRLPLCCHVFHKSCMNAWLLAHNSCPLCRRCILPVSE